MSEACAERVREAGAALIEYIMLLGLVTAMVLFLMKLLYPTEAGTLMNVNKSFETLINQWGDKIATQVAGDKISKDNEDAWGAD